VCLPTPRLCRSRDSVYDGKLIKTDKTNLRVLNTECYEKLAFITITCRLTYEHNQCQTHKMDLYGAGRVWLTPFCDTRSDSRWNLKATINSRRLFGLNLLLVSEISHIIGISYHKTELRILRMHKIIMSSRMYSHRQLQSKFNQTTSADTCHRWYRGDCRRARIMVHRVQKQMQVRQGYLPEKFRNSQRMYNNQNRVREWLHSLWL